MPDINLCEDDQEMQLARKLKKQSKEKKRKGVNEFWINCI